MHSSPARLVQVIRTTRHLPIVRYLNRASTAGAVLYQRSPSGCISTETNHSHQLVLTANVQSPRHHYPPALLNLNALHLSYRFAPTLSPSSEGVKNAAVASPAGCRKHLTWVQGLSPLRSLPRGAALVCQSRLNTTLPPWRTAASSPTATSRCPITAKTLRPSSAQLPPVGRQAALGGGQPWGRWLRETAGRHTHVLDARGA